MNTTHALPKTVYLGAWAVYSPQAAPKPVAIVILARVRGTPFLAFVRPPFHIVGAEVVPATLDDEGALEFASRCSRRALDADSRHVSVDLRGVDRETVARRLSELGLELPAEEAV